MQKQIGFLVLGIFLLAGIGSLSLASRYTGDLSAVVVNALSSLKIQPTQKIDSVVPPIKALPYSNRQMMLNASNGDPRILEQLVKKYGLPQDMGGGRLPAQTTLTGKVEIAHQDDFNDHDKDIFRYILSTKEGKKYTLYTRDQEILKSGATISVTGYAFDKDLIVRAKVLSWPPQLMEQPINHKVAFILINYQDTAATVPYTNQEMHDLVFDGDFKKFFEEQSYGRITFSGDVYGWYTVPRNSTDGPYGCVSTNGSQTSEVGNLVSNIDFSGYDHVVMINYCAYGSYNSGGGSSTVGASNLNMGINPNNKPISASNIQTTAENYTAYNRDLSSSHLMTDFENVLSHEMGHALGVMHSNSLFCGSQVLGGTCEHVEYGNSFDIMGNGGISKHFSVFAKDVLGWFKPQDKQIITQSGTYELNALESRIGKRYAEIQIPGKLYPRYYLEYRKPTGFDASLADPNLSASANGLFVYKSQHSSQSFSVNGNSFVVGNVRLLDVDKKVLSGMYNFQQLLTGASLHYQAPRQQVTTSFTDPATNLSIRVTNQNTQSIQYSVNFGSPTVCSASSSGAPDISEYYMYPYQGVGSQAPYNKFVNFSFGVFNKNNFDCPPTSYVVTVTSPVLAVPSTFIYNDALADDSVVLGAVAYVSPSTSGNQPFTVTVTDQSTGLSSSQIYDIYIN